MGMKHAYTLSLMLLAAVNSFAAQASPVDSTQVVMATIYNDAWEPVAACHVMNLSKQAATTSNKLGIFRIQARPGDTLFIKNIAYREMLVPVSELMDHHYVILDWAHYALPEAKIFEWGNSYGDFREAVVGMPPQESLGEQLGWPRADPHKLPFHVDTEYLKSLGFALTKPVQYFYQNYNRHAKSVRRYYWMEKNQDKQELFDALTGKESLKEITSLEGEDLQAFQAFLYQQMACTCQCSELQIYEEIYALWNVWQSLR